MHCVMDWSDVATTAIKLSGMGRLDMSWCCYIMSSFQDFNSNVMWSYTTSCAKNLEFGHGNLRHRHNAD